MTKKQEHAINLIATMAVLRAKEVTDEAVLKASNLIMATPGNWEALEEAKFRAAEIVREGVSNGARIVKEGVMDASRAVSAY